MIKAVTSYMICCDVCGQPITSTHFKAMWAAKSCLKVWHKHRVRNGRCLCSKCQKSEKAQLILAFEE